MHIYLYRVELAVWYTAERNMLYAIFPMMQQSIDCVEVCDVSPVEPNMIIAIVTG